MVAAQVIADAEAYLDASPINFPRGADIIRRLLPFAQAQAVIDRDMRCDAQCGPEPWTQADEDESERRDHYVESARSYRPEFRL